MVAILGFTYFVLTRLKVFEERLSGRTKGVEEA